MYIRFKNLVFASTTLPTLSIAAENVHHDGT